MNYKTDLDWVKEMGKFNQDEQKVLLALSHEKYKWRRKERLETVTGLEQKDLDGALSNLISQNVIRPSFNRKRDIIFGLKERVGE